MELKKLKEFTEPEQSKKLKYKYNEFGLLIDLLRKRDLPAELVSSMNQYIEGINSLSASNKELLRQVRTAELRILKLIEKEQKLVPRNTYRPRWIAIGTGMDKKALEEGRQLDIEIRPQ
jgi:hypothetical protein